MHVCKSCNNIRRVQTEIKYHKQLYISPISRASKCRWWYYNSKHNWYYGWGNFKASKTALRYSVQIRKKMAFRVWHYIKKENCNDHIWIEVAPWKKNVKSRLSNQQIIIVWNMQMYKLSFKSPIILLTIAHHL